MRQEQFPPSLPPLPPKRPLDGIVLMLTTQGRFSSCIAWAACPHVSEKDIPKLVAELECFDFGSLTEVPDGFSYFLDWLYKLVRSPLYHSWLTLLLTVFIG